MVNGIYSGRNSMMLLQNKLDNNAHNLANASTTGFKQSMLLTRAQVDIQRNDEYLLHQDENQSLSENRLDWDQGPMVQTENPMDVALQGPGLFMVQSPEGELQFSRNGAWTLNAASELTTLSGLKVLDNSGNPIVVEGSNFGLSESGAIYADGQLVGQAGIVEVEDPALNLQRVGRNAFVPVNEDVVVSPATQTKVAQGMLEGSNVNTVDSMVELIRISRQYDFSSKMVTSSDETLQKAVNEIGRVS
jgi:flagellar basal-body rod protein FlgF